MNNISKFVFVILIVLAFYFMAAVSAAEAMAVLNLGEKTLWDGLWIVNATALLGAFWNAGR